MKQEPTAFNELNLNEKYEGEITIKAGETATIINLPEGTKYEVEEILNSNGEYSFESVEVENGIEQNFEKDGAKVTGTINNTAADAPALTLVFTNRIGQPSLALVKKQAIITEETTPDFDSANADNEPPMKVGYGDRVRYFLQVTNTGDQAQTQVVIKDEIPVKPVSGDTRAQSYIAGSAGSVDSGIQIDEGSDCIVWTIDRLEAKANAVVFFDVLVPPVIQTTVWANTGTVTSKETPGSITSNTVKNEEPVDTDLGIVKSQYLNPTSAPSEQEAQLAQTEMLEVNGQSVIRYYLTIHNNSDGDLTNVKIQDNIPVMAISPEGAAPLEYLEGSAKYITGIENSDNLAPTVEDGVIIWTFPTLSPGQKAIVSFDVTVPKVEETTIWRNTSQVVSDKDPENPIQSNPVDSEETPTDLAIEKFQFRNPADDPSQKEAENALQNLLTVDGKDVIRYYLKVTNRGENPQTNVQIIEKLPVAVISGDAAALQKYVADSAKFVAPEPQNRMINVSPPDDPSRIVWTIPTLNGGQTVYVCFDVEVPETSATTMWRNTAYVTSTETPKEIPSNPVENIETPKNPQPSGSLNLEKKQAKNPAGSPSESQFNKGDREQLEVRDGDVIRYFLKATNTGDTVQTNVMVKDKIPVPVLSGNAWSVQPYIQGSAAIVSPKITDSTKGSVSVTDSQITWILNELQPGQSLIVCFDVKVPSVTATTTWKNQGTVVSDQNPNETPSNPVYSDEPVVPGTPPVCPPNCNPCPPGGNLCPPNGPSSGGTNTPSGGNTSTPGGSSSNGSSNNTTTNNTTNNNTTNNTTTNNTTTNGSKSPGTSRNLNVPILAGLMAMAAVGAGAAFVGMKKSKKSRTK